MTSSDERVNELVDVITSADRAPGFKLLEMSRAAEALREQASEIDGRVVGMRATYYASILERNRKLERLLTWVMENTDAGHKQPGQFCVRWVDDRFNTQIHVRLVVRRGDRHSDGARCTEGEITG